jgi:outer membrane protein
MKRLFLTLIVALVSFTAANAQKFALVDMEYILKNIPAYERANEQLNQISKKWEGEINALVSEAETLYKKYQ